MTKPDQPTEKPGDESTNLHPFPERRRGFREAIAAGLSSTEMAILGAGGILKPADRNLPIDFHDGAERIDGTLATIRRIEQIAFDKIIANREPDESGRTEPQD